MAVPRLAAGEGGRRHRLSVSRRAAAAGVAGAVRGGVRDGRGELRRRGAALCWADRRGRPVTPLWRTADFGYLRLHEGAAKPWPRYGRAALTSWPDRCDGPEFFVFFNNDPGGAVIDAGVMAAEAERRDRRISRVPRVRPRR
ncbi:DUF72 domain-containing protein [Actinoplanes lobatus]|uniref:DUF72 domain-containing protein n=1 Tax=Actinoplanes lobatus TaxID=113568 RepID=UPI001E2F30BA|nr:DUF72 domain-containing protein [Actinoplanes lobatus]